MSEGDFGTATPVSFARVSVVPRLFSPVNSRYRELPGQPGMQRNIRYRGLDRHLWTIHTMYYVACLFHSFSSISFSI
ncbi:hypothetical protein CC2G_004083 [Coprinopsis cinerea AmutBmut pab1-1]|nr:hypothetical protein CC2G_004083 [Coprinopsis cinerea AmutBmut pab1-1]